MTQRPSPAGAPGHPDRQDPPAPPGLPPRVAQAYGASDLSTVPVFAGGFINFGYWARLPGTADRPLTEADRIRSEQDLYRLVLGTFDRPAGRTALEVGCGRGLGCALALREFGFGSVTGLDAHPDQIARAHRANAALLGPPTGEPAPGGRTPSPRLDLVRGTADRVPLPDAGTDFLYSVEAAQHFRELTGFAREAARLLRPDGRLALTTFFARDRAAARALPELLPTYADGLDVPHVIDDAAATLTGAGLRDVRVTAIGDGVWAGYDRYMSQQPQFRDAWPRRFLTAYTSGLLDYYVITATAATAAAARGR